MEASSEHDVRAALEEVLEWDELKRSPQLSAFLRYVVEQRLAHRDEAIKAYAIAIDVFRRPQDFDPQTDPIVRVQARRLRALLAQYRAAGLGRAPVRIEIPLGGYVPRFVVREPGNAHADDSEAPLAGRVVPQPADGRPPEAGGLVRQWRKMAVLAGLFALFWIGAAGIVAWQEGDAIEGPLVLVAEFENLALDAQGDSVVAGLGMAMADVLGHTAGIDVRFVREPHATTVPAGDGREAFSVAGVVRRTGNALDYTAVLTDMGSGAQVDDHTISVATGRAGPVLSPSEVAQRMAARFGDYTGPLHSRAQAWVTALDTRWQNDAVYPCVVGHALYRRAPDPVLGAAVLACARAIAAGPEAALARAIEAAMNARSLWLFGQPVPGADLSIAAAAEMARDALSAAPEQALVWELAAFVSLVEGDHDNARARYSAALQLNPGAIDAVAGLAVVDAYTGNWEPAMRRARLVAETAFRPAGWHGLPFALEALRQRRFEDALALTAPVADAVPALGPVLMVAIAARLGDAAVVGRYLPRVMNQSEFQENGILPSLRHYVLDPGLLAEITSGLLLAGLTLDRLTGPY